MCLCSVYPHNKVRTSLDKVLCLNYNVFMIKCRKRGVVLKRVLVIIPAYNEQDCIVDTVNKLLSCTFSSDLKVDYVVINDGSTDKTLQILKENNLSYLNLPMNLGIGGAMQTGYIYAMENDYDYAVQLDGDGQHNPEYIEELINELEAAGANMAVGSRFLKKEGFQSTGMRQLGIKIISGTIKLLTGKKVFDVTSGFRMSDRSLIEYFAFNYAEDYPEPEAIVSAVKSGYKVTEVPVIMNERQSGTSSISGFKSVYYMLKVELAIVIQSIKKRRKVK